MVADFSSRFGIANVKKRDTTAVLGFRGFLFTLTGGAEERGVRGGPQRPAF